MEGILDEETKPTIDIEDIGVSDDFITEDNTDDTQTMEIDSDFVLELPPLSDDEGLLEIGDDFDLDELDDVDFDIDDNDLSDLLLSDARRLEQGQSFVFFQV